MLTWINVCKCSWNITRSKSVLDAVICYCNFESDFSFVLTLYLSPSSGKPGPGAPEKATGACSSSSLSTAPTAAAAIPAHEQVGGGFALNLLEFIPVLVWTLEDMFSFKVNVHVGCCFMSQVQWAEYDAFDEQIDVSARYRVHVGHAYLSFTAVRYSVDCCCLVCAHTGRHS